MNILQAIILGLVQGITEWLPVSSSGHLVIFQKLMGITQPVHFDIVLHLASLLVILLAFRKKILSLFHGLIKLQRGSLIFLFKLFVATLPIAVVGFVFNSQVKSAFESTGVVSVGLFITGSLLLASHLGKEKKRKFSSVKASIIGISQALAILPGVSRSGTTISTGLLLGLRRDDAAFFSFMLFIPAILGATILEAGNVGAVTNIPAVLTGFVVAFISGYASLKFLIRTLHNEKFWYFGFYCFLIAVILLLL